ncbi:MAG: DoxX family protein [Phycisphaeraceae bacterium]
MNSEKLMQSAVSLVGRILLASIFAMSVVGYFRDWSGTTQYMNSVGVTWGEDVLLAGASAFLILGSLSLIFGFLTRWGAILLLLFLAIITPIFHDFWARPEAEFRNEMIQFLKNISIFGGLMMVVAWGAGAASVDALLRRRKARRSGD